MTNSNCNSDRAITVIPAARGLELKQVVSVVICRVAAEIVALRYDSIDRAGMRISRRKCAGTLDSMLYLTLSCIGSVGTS